MEQAGRDLGSVSRGQNVVYVMPHDWASISQFLSPLVDRIDETRAEIQLVVITADAEAAAAVAAAAVRLAAGRPIQILAATSAPRAARLAKLRPPQILAGADTALLELVSTATIKLADVRMVCVAWIDEIATRGGPASLETLMAELSKDAARTIVTSTLTPDVEALLERYARRARRVVAHTPELSEPTPISFLSVSSQSRLGALRRLLDEVNPSSALVFVRDAELEPAAKALLRTLGYSDDDEVRVGRTGTPNMDLAILLDLPATHEELREAAGTAKRTIALVQPRQLASLRALAAGGAITPFTLSEPATRAREREARIRTELRDVLISTPVDRELLALEPLLEDFDGVELAAAALRLLEQERERAKQVERTATAAPRASDTPAAISRARDAGAMTRLFVNVGTRDNARPGDLMGAIANQAGLSSGDVGRIDIRESHSIVEVASAVADTVIDRVTGTSIRGRRALVRRDEERPPRGPGRDAGDRGGRGGRGGAGRSGSGGDRNRGESRGPRGTGRNPRREARE
ncbi:MAG TPA: DbpA RNA binding domain-containing protein [Gemmatimonadaceae bacterium]|nr:DbpA RNA binding domain-containing protein [Gemmatimonadaceae bacterium]